MKALGFTPDTVTPGTEKIATPATPAAPSNKTDMSIADLAEVIRSAVAQFQKQPEPSSVVGDRTKTTEPGKDVRPPVADDPTTKAAEELKASVTSIKTAMGIGLGNTDTATRAKVASALFSKSKVLNPAETAALAAGAR
jgi:hypothetical protein